MQRYSFLAIFAALAVLAAPLAFSQPAQASELQSRANGNMCVDLNQSSGQVALWTCNGGANQNFFTTTYGQQKFNGLCLDQAGSSGSNMWLTFAACNANSRTQRWAVSSAGQLKNESGYCLDVPYGNVAQGQRLQMFTCNNGQNQSWTMTAARPAQVVAAPPATTPAKPGAPAAPLVSNASGTLVGNAGGTAVSKTGGGLITDNGGGLISRTR